MRKANFIPLFIGVLALCAGCFHEAKVNKQHLITVQQAADLTHHFQDSMRAILRSDLQQKNIFPIAEGFDKESLIALLQQKDCDGMRIYLGMDKDGEVRLVLVGTRKDSTDILYADMPNGSMRTAATATGTGGGGPAIILEDGQRCPPYCPPGRNPLTH